MQGKKEFSDVPASNCHVYIRQLFRVMCWYVKRKREQTQKEETGLSQIFSHDNCFFVFFVTVEFQIHRPILIHHLVNTARKVKPHLDLTQVRYRKFCTRKY